MKRSQINKIITQSIVFVGELGFFLPPFAKWTAQDWKTKDESYDDIRKNCLGWDVSDYGGGDFRKLGIVAFTIRSSYEKINGIVEKPYAEKVLILEQGQNLPMHFHPNKVEDLINRGGSDFLIQLYNANADNSLSKSPVEVLMDGRRFKVEAGGVVRVRPGESITLMPRQYHTFWAESGKVLFGEVTMTNNDHHFYKELPGNMQIDEDEAPLYLLSNEYTCG